MDLPWKATTEAPRAECAQRGRRMRAGFVSGHGFNHAVGAASGGAPSGAGIWNFKGATPAGPSLRDQCPRPRRLPRAHSPLLRLALQYCYVHRNRFRQIPLRAMRNAGIPVRVRQVLLPLPDGSRSSPVPGRPAVLRALPRRLRLQNLRLGPLPRVLRSPPLPGTPRTLAASHPKSLPPLHRPRPPAEFAA
jgi:hypothetical protein